MATLAGNSIASSYTSLLKLNGNTDSTAAGNGSNAIQVKTGDDDATPLFLNTDRLGINTQPESALHFNTSSSGGIGGRLIIDNQASDADGNGTEISFFNAAGASASGVSSSRIRSVASGNTNGYSQLQFWTYHASEGHRMTLSSDGNLGLGNAGTFDNPNSASKVLEIATASPVGLILNDTRDANPFCIENRGAVFHIAHGTTSRLIIDDSGRMGVGIVPSTNKAEISDGGFATQLRVHRAVASGSGAFINLSANDDGANVTDYARIGSIVESATGGSEDGALVFHTTLNAASTERMRIDSAGNVGIGTGDGVDTRLHVQEQIDVAYTVDAFTTDANALLKLENSSGTDEAFAAIQFRTGDGADIFIGSKNAAGASNDGSFIVANQSSPDVQFLVLDNNSQVSLSNNDGGSLNTVFGYNALLGATSNVASNVAIGHASAGAMNGTETGNVAMGYQAMGSVDENVNSGSGTNSANLNVAIGYQALTGGQFSDANDSNNKDLVGNIAIGANALDATGTNPVVGAVAIGQSSLSAMTSGTGNTAVGYISGATVTTGSYNTFIGDRSGDGTDDGSSNTAVGYLSLSANCGDSNTAVGMNCLASTTTSSNTGVGWYAGNGLTSGAQNVAIGRSALQVATGTQDCVVIGAFAGDAINDTGANGTVAIGMNALTALTSGQRNVAVGFESLKSNTIGDKNTAVGYQALESYNADGDNEGQNTAVGHNAMQGNVTGTDNTAIGHMSAFSGTNNMTAGDNNTFVGSLTSPSSATPTNQTVIGYNAVGQADNSVTLGNSSVTDVYMSEDSGATVHADYVLSRGNSNHVASSMPSPHYKFDGTDDYISLNEGVDTDDFSFGTEASFSFWVRMPNSSFDAAHTVIGKWHTSAKREYLIFFSDSEQLSFVASSNGSNATTVSSPALTGLATWNHFAVTYNAGAVVIYRNGVSIATGTSESSMYNSVEPVFLGGNEGGTSNDFHGELSCVRFYNRVLTADEVKDESSGASVPFKYKFGGQKILSSSNSSPSGSVGDWVFNGTAGGSIAWDGTLNAIKVTSGGSGTARGHLNTTFMKPLKTGQIIEFTADVYIPSTNGSWTKISMQQADLGGGSSTTENIIANVSTRDAFQTIKSTITVGTDLTGKIEVDGDTGSAGQIFYYKNISAKIKGCVAEYDGSGVQSARWYDKSGNDLHGTVNGPTVENAPSGDDGLIYETGTWVATDGSGAGLSFTLEENTYIRIGNLVTAYMIVTFPTTSDSSLATLTLPYTAESISSSAGGAVLEQNMSTSQSYTACVNGTNACIFRLRGTTSQTNADLSGRKLRFVITYQAV